jgi:asparagine synthase (glutamine-hydrolysing)
MCGIAICILRSAPDATRRVGAMVHAMRHRGPNGHGILPLDVPGWNAALGHRRLSIIDLSPNGAQPMVDESTGVALSANGEIYNYRELRRELETLGVRFRTQSDMEVLLKAYLQWGIASVSRLTGMFAFLLWDPRHACLYLVRDRFGIKPLYYYTTPDAIVAGSEIRAMLQTGIVPRMLNHPALQGYLETGSVISPETLIRGVRSLPPGSLAEWRDGSLAIRKYWDLEQAIRVSGPEPTRDELRDTFLSAVESEMVSDVPIGVFLSGGIDSSALIAALSTRRERDLRTLSLVFEEADLDERAHSREVARRFGTKHTEIVVNAASVADQLPFIAQHQDLPSADGFNTYLVSRAARDAGLTVALSGLGGDELFAGYRSFHLAQAWRWAGPLLNAMPSALRYMFAATARRIPGVPAKAHRVVSSAHTVDDLYTLSREMLPRRIVRQLLGASVNGAHPPSERYPAMRPIDAMTLLEAGGYMLDTTLRQADIMSMANSIEVRVPLLNHRLAELVVRIPPRRRLRSGHPKPALLAALPQSLPDSVVFRRKGTFSLPFETWLRGGHRALAEDLLLSDTTRARGLFDSTVVTQIWNGFLAQAPGMTWSRVWTLCALEAWCRASLDAPVAQPT